MAVTFTDRGTWNKGASYTKFDIVHQDGRSFIAKVDTHPGIPTTRRKHWLKLAPGKTLADITLRETTANCERYNLIYSDGSTGHLQIDYSMITSSDSPSLKRYGVSGIGQSAAALTRTFDAIGMTYTDNGDGTITSDFDNAVPWARKKCVGSWSATEDGKSVFTVSAYQGDPDYTEDGSIGNYVAVECPLCYYSFDSATGELTISAHKYNGMQAFDIFCHDHDQDDLMPFYYRPAYALAKNEDGYAVSLPGLDNEQGNYKQLVDAARSYDDGSVGNAAILTPMALNFYEWALFTVEFATQNCQSIMNGCSSLRNDGADRLTFLDETHLLVSNYYNNRVAGEYIAVLAESVSDINNSSYKATHKIKKVTKCNSSGDPDDSGTYTLLEVEDLGKDYWTYDLTGVTSYKIAGRPYRTGSCASVATPSGSPVSNSDGWHPCQYRWAENPFGNQYYTVMDLFLLLTKDANDQDMCEAYYLPDPTSYEPSSTSKPDATDFATDTFRKCDVEVAAANYVSGYIKSKKYSQNCPDVWIPYETTGGGQTTYFCDYAYLVHSSVSRAVRLGGPLHYGASVGLSIFSGSAAVSAGNSSYGGALCMVQ